MLLKTDVGVASWMGGIGPGEYLSIVDRAGCLLLFSWLLATSSRRARRVCFKEGVCGVPGCMSRPRQLVLGVDCLIVGVLTRGVLGLIVWVPGAGWGGPIVTSGSGSWRGCCLGVLGTVLG